MTTSSPRVSIGMPVFNEERFVGAAIESLLAQTWTDFELIISDNGSTDGTPEICAEYANNDPRVQFVRHTTNHGAAWNFKHVLSLARGKYFMWAGSHDLWAPEYVDTCVDVLDTRANVGLVYTGSAMIDGDEHVVVPQMQDNCARLCANEALDRALGIITELKCCNIIYGLHRSSVLKQCRVGLDCINPDHVLLMEIAMRAKCEYVDEVLFFLREYRDAPKDHIEFYECQLDRLRGPGRTLRPQWHHWQLLYENVIGAVLSPGSKTERARRGVAIGLACYHKWQWGICTDWWLGGWVLAQLMRMVRLGGALRRSISNVLR